MDTAIIGFAGFSGSGKTTLIEKLIPLLRERGLRLALIKHHSHDFEIDREGKDSYRFSHAGAEQVILASKYKTALVEQRGAELCDALRYVYDVDLVIVEGYKDAAIPQIGICRGENGKGFTAELSHFIALVTDIELSASPVPVFGIDDAAGVADFIIKKFGLQALQNT